MVASVGLHDKMDIPSRFKTWTKSDNKRCVLPVSPLVLFCQYGIHHNVGFYCVPCLTERIHKDRNMADNGHILCT